MYTHINTRIYCANAGKHPSINWTFQLTRALCWDHLVPHRRTKCACRCCPWDWESPAFASLQPEWQPSLWNSSFPTLRLKLIILCGFQLLPYYSYEHVRLSISVVALIMTKENTVEWPVVSWFYRSNCVPTMEPSNQIAKPPATKQTVPYWVRLEEGYQPSICHPYHFMLSLGCSLLIDFWHFGSLES